MRMKTYAAVLTGWCFAVIAFDILWICTNMDAFEILFMAMMVGFVGAVAFLMVTDRYFSKKKDDKLSWVTDSNTGLSYMTRRG